MREKIATRNSKKELKPFRYEEMNEKKNDKRGFKQAAKEEKEEKIDGHNILPAKLLDARRESTSFDLCLTFAVS